MKNYLIHKIIKIIYHNQLILSAKQVDDIEFDNINDSLSKLYKKLITLTGWTIPQIFRLMDRIVQHQNKKFY